LSTGKVEKNELRCYAQLSGCDFVFYDKFVKICQQRGISPSRAAVEAGLSKSTVTKWKTTPDAEPTGTAIKKLTEYFGISVAELMGEVEKKPTLTKKDERDIAEQYGKLMDQLDNDCNLMFDGNPLSDEARESILNAMKLGLQAAKLKNKERFTPKKYRKG